ncbi:MAG: porin [Motiliproteus sp.]
MKKQLIALAVAGAMAAPMIAQADATVYGSFRMGVAQTDNNGSGDTDGDLDVVDTSSRIGVKGTVDLGLEGTEGFFKAEWQAIGTDDPDQTDGLRVRLMQTGARGDWGQVTIGKQWMPHYLWISAPTNVFHPGDGSFGERFNLGNTGEGKSGHFLKRTEGSLAYHSPVMNGLQLVAAVVLLGDNDDDNGVADDSVDAYNLAVRYAANGFTAALSYGEMEVGSSSSSTVVSSTGVGTPVSSVTTTTFADNEVENLGLNLKYKANALEVMVKYEEEETTVDGAVTKDEEVIELAVRYTVNGTAVYARVSDYEDKKVAGAAGDLEQWGVGVSKKLGKGIVYLEHVNNDSDDTAGDRTLAGYRLDF